MTTTAAQQLEQQLRAELGKVVFGMDEVLRQFITAWIANGHVLLEGPPGLGKTLLAKALAQLLGGSFGRIQGTADLMPSDLTGVHILNTAHNGFEFAPGPLFNDIVLVDEINRTGPKTQSALLQAMEENAVTLDRKTYPLSADFFLIAAQNPADYEGVYPLLESQLDRFLIRIELSYPDTATEITVLQHYDKPGGGHTQALDTIKALDKQILHQARQEAAAVHVEPELYQYATAIAQATRNHPRLLLGLSTRGALAVMRCARVAAILDGRDYLLPDDIKTVAPAVVGHRLLLSSEALLEGNTSQQLYREIEQQIVIPTATANH